MSAATYVGTSGWQYDHWKGPFYPENYQSDAMLDFYRRKFRAVEINNTFYSLPEQATLEGWRDRVPPDFLFAVKASRYLTHMKKLKDPQEPAETLLDRVQVLKDRLGPVLFQLPPNWRCNPDRLNNLLEVLPQSNRYAFEFRDTSWFDDEVFKILEEARAALCIYDLAGRTSPKVVTADFVYVRLHGPEAAYEGRYSEQALAGWAGACSAWVRENKDVFCFFDNDQAGYAPANAMRLKEMLAGD